ncbi:NADPH-dependent aldehyde reductase-like protein, chloroplastic isoform X1 [Brassica napus]|uniref:NADPH-dependent aldehyde reductase-like protein, chloroplastic isoform X1 n=1 Tax=Brassica napus TaxID=3708 RepID=UPI0020787CFE|nr:NADPH-dependent aldehyde reductase-like protein, chloroplastic isoform X1 [Brassica napus]
MAAQSPPLAGRVAIVTGSSRGIGRAIAIHLAELGARVVVNYTTKSSDADLVAAEINGLPGVTGNGPRAIVVQANVSEPRSRATMRKGWGVGRLQEKRKGESKLSWKRAFESPVHILVNSAGVLDPKYPSIANTSVEDFDRTFRYAADCSLIRIFVFTINSRNVSKLVRIFVFTLRDP